MPRSLSLSVLLLAVSSAFAAGNDEAVIAASPVLDDRYPRSEVAFADGVASYPELVFLRPQGFRPLRLDLYRPKSAPGANSYPLVIYIHGGGWQSGHTRHSGAFANWPNVLASIAAKGFVVASIEYRLSDEAPFPAAIHDVKSSIRWLRANAAQFGIDRTRAVVWGGSAGGQLAALAATSCGDARLQPAFSPADAALAQASDCVQGVVAWYGIFDFKALPEFSAPAGTPNVASAAMKYLKCAGATCEDRVSLASPIAHVGKSTPPALLIHGDRDAVVAVEQSRKFHAALQSNGIASQFVVIEGVDHSFIGATPDATRKASLDALAKTLAFIEATIGGERS
jgi:acetyl esterase/lipase